MTRWLVHHGEILDIPADGLICSANPNMNLSGGVGGAFAVRYGPEMQTYLHAALNRRRIRSLPAGDAIIAPACGSPYQAVAHAVALDPFYDTCEEWILGAYRAAIGGLTHSSCQTIAASCLGCGYGRYPIERFVETAQKLAGEQFPDLASLMFVTTNQELYEHLSSVLPSMRE